MLNMPAGQIFTLSKGIGDLSPATRREVERAYIDTLAVLCAGWNEPVTRALRQTYPHVRAPWEAVSSSDAETTALTWGTAAHALDYDDVHMTSVTHPSAVLVPAIEAVARLVPGTGGRMAGAFAVGLAVNVGLGNAMGFAHYEKGWHATSTIGAVAAGAAIAHLLDLDERAFRSSLAVAAAQSGGLQRNFGTMIKPLQAGLAAQAGIRAAHLARSGLEGPGDVFTGNNGFLAVFEGPPDTRLELDIEAAVAGLSRKLFACCYMAHRPVAAAIRLHEAGASDLLADQDTGVEVEVPPGCLKALTVDIPASGSEAKFSGKYTVAHALSTGRLGLSAFVPESVASPEFAGIARRVVLRETSTAGEAGVGIDRGSVTVSLVRGGSVAARASIEAYPGSPAAPITDAALEAKLSDCIAMGAPHEKDLAARFRSMAKQFAGNA